MLLSPGVEAALFAIVLVALLVLSVVSTRGFLMLCGALLPLMVPRLRLSIGVDWYKVVGPIALALGMFRKRHQGTLGLTRGWGLVLAYCVLVSFVWMSFEYSSLQRYRLAEALELGSAQSYWKMPVQLASFLGQATLVFSVPGWARDRRDAVSAILGYGLGCGLSAAAGLLLIGTATGATREELNRVTFEVESSQLTRVAGLSGEPKFLGACLSVLVCALLAHQLFGEQALVRRTRWLLLLAMIALFMTFSTSAWAGAVVGAAVAIILGFRRGARARATILVVAGMLAVLPLATFGVVGAVVESRLTNRLFGEASEVGKQKDNYVLEALGDNPEHVLWGFGLGGGDLAALSYVTWEEAEYHRTPTAGITGARLLGDLGIGGIGLIVGAVLSWARRLRRQEQDFAATFLVAGLASVALTSAMGLSGYLYLAGAVMTLAHFDAAEQRRFVDAPTRHAVPAGPGAVLS